MKHKAQFGYMNPQYNQPQQQSQHMQPEQQSQYMQPEQQNQYMEKVNNNTLNEGLTSEGQVNIPVNDGNSTNEY